MNPRDNDTLATRLRRLRNERGLGVPDVASSVGVSPGAIRQLESGQTKSPGFALGLRIAGCLNVDPWYLALGEGASLSDRLALIERRLDALEKRRSG
jgi:transcriptional regulator with XRE-family HTH domain